MNEKNYVINAKVINAGLFMDILFNLSTLWEDLVDFYYAAA